MPPFASEPAPVRPLLRLRRLSESLERTSCRHLGVSVPTAPCCMRRSTALSGMCGSGLAP